MTSWDGQERRKDAAGFKCPFCGLQDMETIEVRTNTEGTQIRRRHRCKSCGTRCTSRAQLDPIHTTGSVARTA